MKYIPLIILSFFVNFTSCKTSQHAKNKLEKPLDSKSILAKERAQKIDSLEYVKSIVANKEKYLNKQLSILINDLAIPIKSYSPGMGSDRNVSADVTFSFDDRVTTTNKQGNDLGQKPVYLTIVWQKPLLNSDMIKAIAGSHNNGDWGTIEKEYFSKQIVGDIYYH